MASFYAPLPSTPHAYKRNFSSKPLIFSTHPKRLLFFGNASRTKIIASSSSPNDASANSDAPGDSDASTFCIIEGPETVQDFVQMQLQEIQDNIKSRRNKIFLLMEELRRLRVQQRIKSMKWEPDRENEMPDIPSSIPFLPHVVTLLCNLAHDSITIEVFGLSSFFNYLLVVGFPFAVTQAIYGT
ncbi:protein ORANGE-LIKE, chloroplastic-like, partial [Salvia hispanica]|uniref:protein ORANGE-LIKE, chloroplastic-like n=1 Tax=Salvia hispanica TaxID=49212 RepID=UPI002009316C